MNLYKGLLYTQGYLLDPQYADDATRPPAEEDRRAARDDRPRPEWTRAQRQPSTPPGRARVVASFG